ncbi:MAG TPA: HAD-IA family hydrolase [Terriglobia bacterium]|nr:HAD-IA family hydrolase [Terriglobia bacterium]
MSFAGGKLQNLKLFIFDLDGTLIDSEEDLTDSVNATRERAGMAPLSRETVASYVGQGVTVLVRRALADGTPEEEIDRAVAFFLDYYRQHMLDHTALYPGVLETLQQLKPRKLAVLTNKAVNFSRQILAGLNVDSYFGFVYGGNSFGQKKPDPVGIFRLMRDTGAREAETLMIGDSETDIQTGRNAGVWTCGVTYGIGSHTLAGTAPDLMLNSLRELPFYLNGHAAG